MPILNSRLFRLVSFGLLVTVLATLALSLALIAPVGQQRSALYSLPVPGQVAAIVAALDAAPVDLRQPIIEALNTPALKVSLLDDLPEPAARQHPRILLSLYGHYATVLSGHTVRVVTQAPVYLQALIGAVPPERLYWAPVQIYVGLHGGGVVRIEPARAALLDAFLPRALAVCALICALAIVILVISVRETTLPLIRLSANAKQFADRLDAPDLPIAGPRELGELAQSFNEMKVRIRGLMAERTRLLAAIAHDMRTYLTRLRLRMDYIADDDQRARAEADLTEMSHLLDDTLLFARASGAHGPEPAEPANIIRELEAFVQSRRELGDLVELGPLLVDRAMTSIESRMLRRVLSNLVDNALRYAHCARIGLAPAGDDAWCVNIDDDGPGIPESEYQRMLSPFERLEPSRGRSSGGAGLGLSIVKALVEADGGGVAFEHPAGGGFRVIVRLRRAG